MRVDFVWHVVKGIDDQNWFPDDAVLNRDASNQSTTPTVCWEVQVNPTQ